MPRIDTVRALQLFNFARFGTTLLLSILLVRLGLSAADIAIYESLLFYAAALTAFWVSGGQTAALSLVPRLKGPAVAALLWQVALLFFGLSALSALIVYAMAPLYIGWFTSFEQLPHLGLLAMYVWLNVPGFLLHIFYQLRDNSRALVGWSILNWGAQLTAVLLPLVLGHGLRGVFVGLTALGLLRLLLLFGQLARWHTPKLGGIDTLRRYGLIFVPLALTALLEGSVELIDGLLVGRYFDDPATFAYYRYGAKELPLSLLLIGPVVAVGIQLAAGDLAAGLREAKDRLRRIGWGLYPLSALLLLVAPYLFTTVYSPAYSVSAQLFSVYLLLISSRMLVPQLVLIARGHNYALLAVSVLEILANASLSYWLIGPLGLLGIAWGSVVAYLLGKLLLVAYVYFRLGVAPRRYLPVGTWFWGNVGLVLLYLWVG